MTRIEVVSGGVMRSVSRLAVFVRVVYFVLTIYVIESATLWAQSALPYRDPKLSVEERVADLLSRMTLEEKAAQLGSTWQNRQFPQDPKVFVVDEKGAFVPERAAVELKNGLGEYSRPSEQRGPREMAEFTNTVQRWLRENTRLGIPAVFHEECLHGHAALRGTAYPQAIGLASTWDLGLVQEIFSATAAEVRARGAQQCLTPVLDLARDPRWGRTEETYGEDPYLGSRIGVAAIQGFQGTGPFIDKTHVISTAKHFAVTAQPEGGTNTAPGNYSEHVIREYFLKPFETVVKEGPVESVMASYNEIDGVPAHANKHLLDDILRHEWGFRGVVVSDYFGIAELRRIHHVVENNEAGAKVAIESGVDIELPFTEAYGILVPQVTEGKTAEAAVDRALATVLRVKFLVGHFDDLYFDSESRENISTTSDNNH